MKARAVLVLAIIWIAASEAAAQEPPKKEQDLIQGTWLVVRAVHDGHPYPADKTKSCKLTIGGDKLTVHGDKGMESILKLDAVKNPKVIDITPSDGPDKGKVLQGIYETNGDELRICFSKPGRERPTEFASKENSGIVLVELKREK